MPSNDPAAPERSVVIADRAALKSVLIVKLSSLGDVIHTLPLLDALRAGLGPDVRIGWAVRSKFSSLLEGNPHLTAIYRLERGGLAATAPFGKELRAAGWDAALDPQGLLISGIVTGLSGAPLRIGLDQNRECNRAFLTHPIVSGRQRIHVVDKLLGFCDPLGIPRLTPRRQEYLANGEADAAAALLKGMAQGPIAGLIVGASRADKAWPEERWIELAKRLSAAGVLPVLLGGPGEAELASRIENAAPGAIARNLAGKTSPKVLASVLARCNVVAGGDSGPMHLAVAVGTPVAGLYGVTDPAQTGPQWGPGPSVILDYAEADAPPEERRPRHTTLTDALSRIPAEAVADAMFRLIGETKASQELS